MCALVTGVQTCALPILGGPRIYRFRELVDWITRTIRCRRIILTLPDSIGALIAAFDFLPGAPITRDQWLMLGHANMTAKAATGLAASGLSPTPLNSAAPGTSDQRRLATDCPRPSRPRWPPYHST